MRKQGIGYMRGTDLRGTDGGINVPESPRTVTVEVDKRTSQTERIRGHTKTSEVGPFQGVITSRM
jgi:hypothetical protein